MIVGANINLHSGCILAVVLTSVCGQVIYMVLVSCLMGYGPAALNVCHVDVIIHVPICLIWCDF